MTIATIAPKKEMFQAERMDLSPVLGMRVPSVTLMLKEPGCAGGADQGPPRSGGRGGLAIPWFEEVAHGTTAATSS